MGFPTFPTLAAMGGSRQWRWAMGALTLALACCSAHCDEADDGEKEPNSTEISIAATLMATIAFQMSLFYMMNHEDEDMRKYTYEIISSTVSIFCAVLLFQSCNDLVDQSVKDLSEEAKLVVNMVHMVLWFVLLQACLALISGALGGSDAAFNTMGAEQREDVKAQMSCFAVLIAHITGFASINAWGGVQHLELFAQSPMMSLAVVPMALVGQLLLQRIFEAIRVKVALADDGEVDAAEEIWIESTAEAENDVMALCGSFLFAQAIRFHIGGHHLPSKTGAEEWDELKEHGTKESLILFSIGIFMALLSAFLKFKEPSHDFHGPAVMRGYECLEVTVNMCFSWCAFYSFQWFTASLSFVQAAGKNMMLLDVVTAMFACMVAFVMIYIFDKFNDFMESKVGEEVKEHHHEEHSEGHGEHGHGHGEHGNGHGTKASRTKDAVCFVISGMGIFVGFAWEQCFDVATESLSAVLPAQHLSKLGLAIGCAVIIVPAWRWWILPMVIKEGWKFGFVLEPNADIWEKVVTNKRFSNMMQVVKEKHEDGMKKPLLGTRSHTQEVLHDAEHALAEIDPQSGSAHEVQELTKRNKRLEEAFERALECFHDHMDKTMRAMDQLDTSLTTN